MKCRQVKELAGAYIYGDLAPEEMRDIRLHARNCDACREDLAARARVISSIDDTVPELTDEEKQRIMWSVKGAVYTKNTAQRTFILRLAPALGLAAVLLLGFGIGKLAYINTPSNHSSSIASKAKISVREILPSKKDRNKNTNNEDDNGVTVPNPFGSIGSIYRPYFTDRNNESLQRPPYMAEEPPAKVKENKKDTAKTERKTQVVKENQQSPTKDSNEVSKKSESGTESGETALPKPTDLNNAETAPGTSE